MLGSGVNRRELIISMLSNDKATSASKIASKLGVSRQVVVGDIALLRAQGYDIHASARGYIIDYGKEQVVRNRIKCRHSSSQCREELNILVDYGCKVVDVVVEHPVYGDLVGQLQIASRLDVEHFMEAVNKAQAHSLSELTDGIHVHTIESPDRECFELARERLLECGILVED